MMNDKIVFCIVFCILLCGCGNSNSSKNSISNTEKSTITKEITEQQKSDNPEFLFEHLSYDFGEITQGEQRSCVFYFKNVGSSSLMIYDVSVSCGCTSSIFSKEPVLPEEEGEITVTFDSKGKSGKVSNYVVVSANTYPANVVLTLHADIITP